MSDPTYACSLDAGALAGRLAGWRALDAALIERRREGGRLTGVYSRRPEVVTALRELVTAEAECCPFLRTTLREEADRLVLDVEAPPGAEELLGDSGTSLPAG